ncbi:MAG: hypothetical protein ACFFBP_21905 [Promethearchaeota archaeon]
MKRSRIFSICLLMTILIVPFIGMSTIVSAQNQPTYVGVNEGQVITWKTEFDDGPLEDFFEDLGVPEASIDDAVDLVWDPLEYDDDVVAWKVIIDEIKDEDDVDYDGMHFDEKDVDYVKVVIAIYETEDQADANAWNVIDRVEKFILYSPEEKVYADLVYESFSPIPEYELGKGLYTLDDDYDSEWPMFFTPKRLDWDDIVDEVDEKLEDENLDDEISISEEKATFFFQEREVGLETNMEDESDILEDFDSSIKFTNDGVMYYYEWSYDGDTIAKFELDTIGGVYLIENWWWIALIAAGVVVLVIVIIVIIKVKKRK